MLKSPISDMIMEKHFIGYRPFKFIHVLIAVFATQCKMSKIVSYFFWYFALLNAKLCIFEFGLN